MPYIMTIAAWELFKLTEAYKRLRTCAVKIIDTDLEKQTETERKAFMADLEETLFGVK
jgi:hypothetical protein